MPSPRRFDFHTTSSINGHPVHMNDSCLDTSCVNPIKRWTGNSTKYIKISFAGSEDVMKKFVDEDKNIFSVEQLTTTLFTTILFGRV